MAGLRKKQRIQLIAIGAVFLTLGSIAVFYGLNRAGGVQFFRSPTEVAEAPPAPSEQFRVGGLVEEGSVVRGSGETVSFTVTDGNEAVTIEYTGILPDLFREGQGMIALGSLEGEIFRASEVLAKHDENYMPKEVADALKEQGLFKGEEGS